MTKKARGEMTGARTGVKAMLVTFYAMGLSIVALLVIHALRDDADSTSWILALIWGGALLLIVRVTVRVWRD